MVTFPQLDQTRAFPETEFFNLRDVVVFLAHRAQLSDGRTVDFGREELAAIVENNNRRIAESGDYAVITLGHTPAPGEDKPQPEVVGFAGPFRLGEFAGKPAILADFHIFRRLKDVLNRYPRRSPEFRLTDDLRQTHLDPIALLGAEPPRLDMGLTLLYSERRGEVVVERYAATLPAASNTFVPAGGPAVRNKERFSMNEELLQQIVEALEKLDWVQWIKRKMAEEQAAGQTQTASEPAAPQGGSATQQGTSDAGQGDLPPASQDPTGDARERDADRQLRERYQLLSQQVERQRTELQAIRHQLEEERATRINAERYSQLVQLRQVYAFDLAKEVERCRYSRMSDEQFRDHLEMIRENYRPIPIGERIPWEAAPAGSDHERERYSEDVRRRALAIAKRRKEAGEEVVYEELLEQVRAGKL